METGEKSQCFLSSSPYLISTSSRSACEHVISRGPKLHTPPKRRIFGLIWVLDPDFVTQRNTKLHFEENATAASSSAFSSMWSLSFEWIPTCFNKVDIYIKRQSPCQTSAIASAVCAAAWLA